MTLHFKVGFYHFNEYVTIKNKQLSILAKYSYLRSNINNKFLFQRSG